MTLKELKEKAAALFAHIEECMNNDEEWTSPRGNGTNAFEAIEAAKAFNDLIQQTE